MRIWQGEGSVGPGGPAAGGGATTKPLPASAKAAEAGARSLGGMCVWSRAFLKGPRSRIGAAPGTFSLGSGTVLRVRSRPERLRVHEAPLLMAPMGAGGPPGPPGPPEFILQLRPLSLLVGSHGNPVHAAGGDLVRHGRRMPALASQPSSCVDPEGGTGFGTPSPWPRPRPRPRPARRGS